MSSPSGGSPELQRALGPVDVVAVNLNTIVGAGIFALPAALAAAAGKLSLAVLLTAFLLVTLLALCTAEVASRYDATGGPMYYASVAFGPAAGFVIGWLMYLSRLAAFGAIAAIGIDYAVGLWHPLAAPVARVVTVTVFIIIVAALNVQGVTHGAWLSNILTIAKGVPLALLAIAGLWLMGWRAAPTAVPHGLAELSRGLLIAFFACMGFEQAAVIAGEVRNPQRNVAAGILIAEAVVGIVYALLMFVCFATVPDLAHSTRPLAEAAAAIVGPAGATVVSLTAVLSCAGGLSASTMITPRVLYALAAQGDLPPALARIASVRHTPATAIVTTAVIFWLLTVSGTFVYLATFSVIARMLMYSSTCVALITLRRRDGPAPITIPWGPVLAVIAVLACTITLVTATGTGVRDVAIAVATGWAVRTMVRRRASRVS